MKKITLNTLYQLKKQKKNIAAITAYDASFTSLVSECGIELILVGDSLGVTTLGYETTYPVTLDQMIHHTKACSRPKPAAFVMADMPFNTYAIKEEALQNASKLIQAGAEMVKLEGGEFLAETVAFLTERGIPVCGHLGLMPQFCHIHGGYRFGSEQKLKTDTHYIHEAKVLEEAGAKLLILKCMKSSIAEKIANLLTIPVVGIGSGLFLDGQIQILHDLLGFGDTTSSLLSMRYVNEGKESSIRYARNFLRDQNEGLRGAIKNYVEAVKQETFPLASECFL